MESVKIKVRNDVGLHARPAAMLVEKVQSFSSEVIVSHNGRSANAKSLLGILGLGVTAGCEIIIIANGKDEKNVIVDLVGLIESNFNQGSTE